MATLEIGCLTTTLECIHKLRCCCFSGGIDLLGEEGGVKWFPPCNYVGSRSCLFFNGFREVIIFHPTFLRGSALRRKMVSKRLMEHLGLSAGEEHLVLETIKNDNIRNTDDSMNGHSKKPRLKISISRR
ncbi:hypothetical protein CEXT_665111 [Caerostris extrusa]|uniref:Uncharacterized protein n=1 Tax=Caerostris extrusa TaxID=172846 RepID=A0AAV4RIT9_CAEEX|nr:hypothetical protein CEXT_665111 [Caerostris extrusa]